MDLALPDKHVLPMLRIDAHQHFWKYDPVRDSWINEEMQNIRKDFFPDDLKPILRKHQFDGCVAVQASESMKENEFLSELADESPFIRGVVGWIDIFSNEVEDQLELCSIWPQIKGFRNILQHRQVRDCMLQPEFIKGLRTLNKYGYSYDLLVLADQLPYVKELVAQFPNQKFVIDHIAKPDIKNGHLQEWSRWMAEIARYENVSCKISGMVTEADWKIWCDEDFYPCIETVVEAFGTERIMYGSDWPVCLVAASYEETLGIVQDYFASFSENEQEKFFGGNAVEFYNLDI